jgi:hypothetical protein
MQQTPHSVQSAAHYPIAASMSLDSLSNLDCYTDPRRPGAVCLMVSSSALAKRPAVDLLRRRRPPLHCAPFNDPLLPEIFRWWFDRNPQLARFGSRVGVCL